MLESSPGPVLRVSRRNRVLFANRAAVRGCREWDVRRGARVPDPLQAHIDGVREAGEERYTDLSCGDRRFSLVFRPVQDEIHIHGWEITQHRETVETLRAQTREDERDLAELEARVRARTVELQRRADQLARMASELTLAEQRERRRLAKLLHDHLQQLLVGAKFGLQVLGNQVDVEHRQSLDEVRDLIDESIGASRSLTMELSPPILHEGGLGAGLAWLARWMKDRHGLEVTPAIDPAVRTEREDVRVLVFEAARELLFNVAKHAGVSETRLALGHRDENTLIVTVEDEGVGFDAEEIADSEEPHGFGLLSIRERLAHLGGALEIHSTPGSGSVCIVAAPVTVEGTPMDSTGSSSQSDGTLGSDRDGPIEILLADDHAVLRQGLKLLIAEEEDMTVVGEAADGEEAVDRARDLNPDIVLMDFSMPKLDGVAATRIIRKEAPATRVIALSMYDEADRADAMLEAGANAYLTKSGDPAVLLSTIRRVGRDGDHDGRGEGE